MKSSYRMRAIRGASVALALSLAVPFATAPVLADARSESVGSYQKAQKLFANGDYRAARIELLKALKANPNNGLARLLNARTALEMGSGVAAETEIERAIQAGIPRDKTQHLLAHALVLQRQYTRAFEAADPKLVPPQFAAYAARMRGRALTGMKREDAAREHFETAERLAPNDPETLVDLARYYILVREAPRADALADRALAVQPTHAKALLIKGDIARTNKGLAQALPYFNRALQSDPNNVEALLERAATLGDMGREKEARADLKRVTGFIPEHPLALYLQAVMETRAGKYQLAQELMTRTKGQLDQYPPALLLQGMIAYQLNNVAQANEFLGKVVAAAPNATLPRKLYGATQLRKGDPQGAIETLRPVAAAGQADARTLALLGSAYARIGDFEQAQKYLEQAKDADPGENALRTQLAMTQLAQGDAAAAGKELDAILSKDANSLQALAMKSLLALRKADYRSALDTSNKIIQAYPQLPMGYNLRGAAALGLGNMKAAEANFRLAIQKKPDFNEARRNLAQLLVATNRAPEARKELLQILQSDKNNVRAMFGLARLAAADGKSGEQIGWLKRAAGVSPTTFGPRAELTQAYMRIGQKKAALDEASALMRDFPKDIRALELAGLINAASGRMAEAEAIYSRMASVAPNAVGPRLLLARSQEANGKFDDARQTYSRALTLPQQTVFPVYLDLIAFEGRRGRWDAAQANAARLRQLLPKQNIADIALGDAYLASGQTAQALAQYEAARKIRFDRSAALKLAAGHVAARQPQQALAILNSYAKAQPKDLRIKAAIGDVYMAQRQWKQAAAVYEQLRVATRSADAGVLNNLAYAYQMLGDKRMVATAQRAYQLAPASPAIIDTYGWILVTSKTNPKLALQLMQKASLGAPRDPNIRYHLAEAYRINGKSADAVRELRMALKTKRFENRARAQALLTALLR